MYEGKEKTIIERKNLKKRNNSFNFKIKNNEVYNSLIEIRNYNQIKRKKTFLKANNIQIENILKKNLNKIKSEIKDNIDNIKIKLEIEFTIEGKKKISQEKYSQYSITDSATFFNAIEDNTKKKDEKMKINSNKMKLIGFKNIGSSCYMNSVLQILFRIPGFLTNLREYYNSSNYNNDCLIESLITLSDNPDSIDALKAIKREMAKIDESYGKYIQNDSQRFGIDLINQIILSMKGESSFYDDTEDEIEKEVEVEENYNNFINNSQIKLNSFEKMFLFHESFIKFNIKSLLKNGFENWLNIDLVFPDNRKEYVIEQLLDMKYLNHNNMPSQLNIKNSQRIDQNINDKDSICIHQEYNDNYLKKIYDLINYKIGLINSNNYSNSYNFQEVDNHDYFYIFNIILEYLKNFLNKLFSNKETINDKTIFNIKQIASLPNILIITINRAILGEPLHKNKIIVGKYLNLSNYLDKKIFKNESDSAIYKLFAVNECNSIFHNFGHYVSYVNVEEDKWVKFDDTKITNENPNLNKNRYIVGLYYIKEQF